jgi:hypothetical protein
LVVGFLEDGAGVLPPVKVDFVPSTGAIDEYAALDSNQVRAALIDLRQYAQGLGRDFTTLDEDIQDARTLAGSRTRVWYRTTEPANNPSDPHRVDDLWFDTSLYTQADVDAERCAVADIGKKRYDSYRWDGDSWEPVNRTKLIIAAEIAAGAIAAQHISTVGLDASVITSGIISAQFIDVEGIVIGAANVDETLQAIIEQARDNAEAALEQLGAIGSDDKVTRNERSSLMRDARSVYAEYALYIGMAQRYDGTPVAINTGSYEDAYEALGTHLKAAVGTEATPSGLGFPATYGTVEADATTWVKIGPADPIHVDGATLRRVFEVYYLARATLLDSIAIASKSVTDTLGGQIQDAQDDLDEVLPKLADIASDDKLTAGEKGRVMREARECFFERPALLSQASLFDETPTPVPTEKVTAYTVAYDALYAYLTNAPPAGLGMPTDFGNNSSAANGWVTNEATIPVTGSALRGAFETYFQASLDLLDAVWLSSKAESDTKITANALAPLWQDINTAKDDAAAALGVLAKIGSDSWLTAGEKPAVIKEWNAIGAERGDYDSRATAAGLKAGAEWYGYSTRLDELQWYLDTRSPSYSDTTTDTPIVPSEWQAYWGNYFNARTTLATAIFNAKIQSGDVNRNVTSISGGVITTGYVNADRIDANAFQTIGYDQQVVGKDTAAERCTGDGTRIKGNRPEGGPGIITGPGGIRIGAKTLSETWLSQGRFVAVHLTSSGGATLAQRSPIGIPAGGVCYQYDSPQYDLVLVPTGVPNVPAIVTVNGRHGNGTPMMVLLANTSTDASGNLLFGMMSSTSGDPVTNLLGDTWTANVTIMLAASPF